jgi:hypothetical protein
LVDIGDVDEMADKITRFLQYPPKPEEMQAILANRYDVSVIASCYYDLIKSGGSKSSHV